jgi:hypothetical protein
MLAATEGGTMMLSKLRRLPDVVPSPTSRVRFAVLASVLFAAFAFAGAAIAANIYWASPLSPGGYASTGGWNNRTYNWACRDDGTGNTGKTQVAFFLTTDPPDDPSYKSGIVDSRCSTGVYARLDFSGYFKCRCWNKGTISFKVVCQTNI